MAIQQILDAKGEPTHVVLTIEEWHGFLSGNTNKLEILKGEIEIPQEVQDEVLAIQEKATASSGISREELRKRLGK